MGVRCLLGILDARVVQELYKIVAPSKVNVEKVYAGLITISNEFQKSSQRWLKVGFLERSSPVQQDANFRATFFDKVVQASTSNKSNERVCQRGDWPRIRSESPEFSRNSFWYVRQSNANGVRLEPRCRPK